MSGNKYKLYRKMSIDEYDSLLGNGLVIEESCKSLICPKKCLSESIIAPYRLTPYRSAISQVIAEISFPDSYREELLETGQELLKPIHTDRNYTGYQKYEGRNLYYKCHGSTIRIYNHEIDKTQLALFNKNITDIKIVNPESYIDILLNSYFGISGFQSFLTTNYLKPGEYYIQMPVDLAILALHYKSIPVGGLNKHIKCRIIGKDYEYIDHINNHIFPVTLAIKVRDNLANSKIRNFMIAKDTFAINSQNLYRLNSAIDDIRLVEYKEERSNYKYASNVLNEEISMLNILRDEIKSSFSYEENHLTLDETLNIIRNNKLSEYFINNITNINNSLYLANEYHGKSHAERVCLFSYLIATHLGLNETEIKCLIKASLLHDIGKESDDKDEQHGLRGADKIEELALFMNNQEAKNMVKFLIEAHALDRNDLALAELMKKYSIPNSHRTLTILNILMDADAIDRTRFTVFGNSAAGLNPTYLCFDYSHRLVSLSKIISELYYDNKNMVLTKTLSEKA